MKQQRIEVPTSLNDIPLSQYQQFMQIDNEASDTFRAKRILNIFCGINPKDFNKIKHQDIENLLFKIGNVLNSQPKLQRTFTIDGIKYGLIPNFDEMTMGEFVDLDNIKDYSKDLDKLASIIFRKVTFEKGVRYEIEPYSETFRFKDIPTGIALGALVFFWTIGRDCLNATQSYTKARAKQMKPISALGKSGGGTGQSLASATETLRKSMLSLVSHTIPSYYGLLIKAIWQPYKEQK